MFHKTDKPCHGILLSLQMICDEMDDLFWDYSARLLQDAPVLNGVRLFYPGCQLTKGLLYIVPDPLIDQFPIDEYTYATHANAHGQIPHISSISHPTEEILDVFLALFQRYKEFEIALNSVVTGDGTLTQLCMIGVEFFKNPLYIHDSMFSIIALPKRVQGMLEFDVNKETGEMHIPLWLINDFKFDEDYQATLLKHDAGIWGHDQFPHPIRSLYVNLWEGDYYYGRLLINEIESSMKPGQFYLAERFAEYCKLIIRRDNQRSSHGYVDHEETLRSLASGNKVHQSDLNSMMDTLGWKRDDVFLFLKIASQDPGISVRTDSALRSRIAGLFKGSVQFFQEQSLCVLFNITQMSIRPSDISKNLAPVIRDNYLFGGLSNPVRLIPDLKYGAMQADQALDYMKKQRTMRWLIDFTDCSLDYILENTAHEIPRKMLIPPILYQIRSFDHEKGTQYYETLRTYLQCERSIPKTSATLFIHRTTLLYRLEKLNEMLKMNLDDEDARLHLILSFRFMDEERLPDFNWDSP